MSVDREIRMSLRLTGYSRGQSIPGWRSPSQGIGTGLFAAGLPSLRIPKKAASLGEMLRKQARPRPYGIRKYCYHALLHVRSSVGTKRGCDRMHLQTCSTAQRRRSKSILLFCVALRCTRRFVRVRAESTIAGANEGGATGTTLPCPNASTETPTFRHQTWPILVLFVCCSP